MEEFQQAPVDEGCAAIHGVAKSQTTTERLNSIKNTIIFCDFFFPFDAPKQATLQGTEKQVMFLQYGFRHYITLTFCFALPFEDKLPHLSRLHSVSLEIPYGQKN